MLELNAISLEMLSSKEKLDYYALRSCTRNGLMNLEDIFQYYLNNGNFRRLKLPNEHTNRKLIAICEKYSYCALNLHFKNENQIESKGEGITKEIPNYSLDDLSQIDGLSVRAITICLNYELTNLENILHFYFIPKESFNHLRNCGKNTVKELIRLCKKYENYIINPSIAIPINPLLLKIDLLTVKQRQIISNLIISKFSGLTVRSQNALIGYLQDDITFRNFADRIFLDPDFNFKSIRNVGEKAELEINTFIETIKGQVELVSSYHDDNEIEFKLYETFLIENFSLNDSLILKIIEDYDLSNGLPIFRIIKSLVDNDILFEIREKQIFYNEFCNIDEKEYKSLSDFSIEFGLTRERVRQIRVQFLGKFESYFRFITQPEIKSLVNYNIDLSAYLIDISNDLIDFINSSERVQFNRLFIVRILSILYVDKYDLIGRFSYNKFKNDYTSDKWEKSYLIDNKIVSIFNFDLFYIDVKNRLSNRIKEDYKFNFYSYLLNFIRSSKYEMPDIIVEIATFILFYEFELSIDTCGNIVFKRNTKKQVIEYVYEVLLEKNEFLTVYEMYDLIENKYPGVTKSAEALRGSCQSDSDLIYFGKSSTYGLKIWEDEINYPSVSGRGIKTQKYHRKILAIRRATVKNKNLDTELDRRRKLTNDQKENIKSLAPFHSISELAREYNVSRRTIQFIIYPERQAASLSLRKHGDWRKYYNKEKQAAAAKTAREYKEELIRNGKILK